MKKFVPVLLLAIAAPALAQQSYDPVADFMGRFDANKDGKVTREEFTAPQLEVMAKQFDYMDKNKDGKITLEEFKSPQQEVISQQYQYMDKNGDGNLDEAEVQAFGEMAHPRTQ